MTSKNGSGCLKARSTLGFVFINLHHSDRIIVEYGWNVFRWELVRGVADQEAGLADGAIANHNAPKAQGKLA